MTTNRWDTGDIPDQHGNHVVITGATSGIGYAAALALAGKGARIVLGARDEGRARAAIERIHSQHAAASLEYIALDLADLASIRQFVATFRERFGALQLLINNAGVMATPFHTTADGFELQFGTNHLGHFALTVGLLPALLAASAARIVTVSSINHRMGLLGALDSEHLSSPAGYSPWGAYARSKLANLLFAYELQRRLEAAGARAISVACHPGFTATNLQFAGPRMTGNYLGIAFWKLAQLFAQDAAHGALPTLYAATAPDVNGGDYIGPEGIGELRGYPGKVRSSARSHDQAAARRLWELSEQLCGVETNFTLPDSVTT
jgi:NAD(P)-dependent dehydrogenase (short-subunit alcohol dehydrogenase family)